MSITKTLPHWDMTPIYPVTRDFRIEVIFRVEYSKGWGTKQLLVTNTSFLH